MTEKSHYVSSLLMYKRTGQKFTKNILKTISAKCQFFGLKQKSNIIQKVSNVSKSCSRLKTRLQCSVSRINSALYGTDSKGAKHLNPVSHYTQDIQLIRVTSFYQLL